MSEAVSDTPVLVSDTEVPVSDTPVFAGSTKPQSDDPTSALERAIAALKAGDLVGLRARGASLITS